MTLDLVDLDSCTRRFMLAEVAADLAAGALYLSPQLTEAGRAHYADLLRAAIAGGSEASLADALVAHAAVKPPDRWQRSAERSSEAGTTEALRAAALLAEREFHRFYIRGLCRRALAEGVLALEIYRARPPDTRRSHPDAMIGVKVMAASLLEDLSRGFQMSPPTGLPQCRDPGLSVRLPGGPGARR